MNTLLDIDPAEARAILPPLTHYVCTYCWPKILEPDALGLCGSPCFDGHVCPDDMSCGCVMCPECDDLEKYDEPCARCEGHA